MASQYLTLYKIIVLYMLRRSEVALSKSQIFDFILGNEYTTFMTLQEAFGELGDQKLIEEKKVRNRTYLELTPAGEEALDFFGTKMDPGIREQIDLYLKENRINIRDEALILSDYGRCMDGTYEIHLTAKEMNSTLIDIRMMVPDKSMAEVMCDKWKDRSSGIYRYLMEELSE
ncbi:DUF4364 family protein [Butyrivibrio sp. MC2013]|uniref:DUF4364 family protein n=1 Tax=Butyrivibrio sp. MC2013 TaxID=1280686 RepID=UPI0003F8F25C|nr:DUF4364 family protein [Butyrivibrio sp. MC2013]